MLPKETLLKDLKIKLAINRIVYPLLSLVLVVIGIVTLIKDPKSALWIIPVVIGSINYLMCLLARKHLKKLIAEMEMEQKIDNIPQSTKNE